MIILTPAAGSVPEPRPQSLVTGDRAITLLDASASTALVGAGVQVVTVKLAVYNEIVTALGPEVSPDVDPSTGLIRDNLLPARLSAGAIAALNLLDSATHTLSETYVPARLSTTNVTALIAANSQAQTTSDPDGTPVILAAPTAGGTSVTYSGTVTAATVTAGTTHGDLVTANVATLGTVEITGSVALDAQAVQPVVTDSGLKLYNDGLGRLAYTDAAATKRRVSGIQILTGASWPSGAQIGDQAIMNATGEHRVYKGSTLGWRLLGQHTVSSIAERNAIAQPYEGMKVWCNYGYAQENYWSGGKWWGTKITRIGGGPVRGQGGVNDTNWRRWNETVIPDPGFNYFLHGSLGMEVVQVANRYRASVWMSLCDTGTGQNWTTYAKSYGDSEPKSPWYHFDMTMQTWDWQSGTRTACVDWRVFGNGANAYSADWEAHCEYLVIPA